MTTQSQTIKVYSCQVCKTEQDERTNHTGHILSYCKTCSWKGEGFGHGVYMFNALYRRFHFVREYK